MTPHADQVHPSRAVIGKQAGQAAFPPQRLDLAGQITENCLQDLAFLAVLGAVFCEPGADDRLVDALPEPEFDYEPRLPRDCTVNYHWNLPGWRTVSQTWMMKMPVHWPRGGSERSLSRPPAAPGQPGDTAGGCTWTRTGGGRCPWG